MWYCNSPVGVYILDLMLKLMSFRAGIRPHLTNHCLRGTLVTVLSLVTSFLTTTLRRGTLNQPPATSPTIESKLTTIDLPSTNKRSCLKRSVPSFMAMKTLQLTKRTQQDGSWTYRLQLIHRGNSSIPSISSRPA